MQFGDSFGEPCRRCGTTAIIVAPACAAGRCAACSHEVAEWKQRRREDLARRETLAAAAAEAVERDVAELRRRARTASRLDRWRRLGAGIGRLLGGPAGTSEQSPRACLPSR